MLYKKNIYPKIAKELFENPTSEYRGAPFWAWNCKLDRDTLNEQIDIFKEMGLGGFHMHVRTGMETPYLSDEFVGYIKQCVDKAIKTVPRPKIIKGVNELVVTIPLAERTNLEYMYLLGNFGAAVLGRYKRITAPVEKLWFGSFTHQGLPFYTGNVTYEFTENVTGGSPKLYGTRLNGFGQLHPDTTVEYYQAPNSWRTTDQLWTYEYQLKDFGILKTPEVR